MFETESAKFEGEPIVVCTISLDDGDKYYAKLDASDVETFYEGLVKTFGQVSRSVGYMGGNFESSNITSRFINIKDRRGNREFSDLDYKKLINRKVNYKVGFIKNDRPNFKSFYNGIIEKFNYPPSEFQLVVKDISKKYFQTDDYAITITSDLYPNLHIGIEGEKMPILYGEITSENKTDKGFCKTYHIDTVDNKYLVAGHACKDVMNVYALNQDGSLYQKLSSPANYSWGNGNSLPVLNPDFEDWTGDVPDDWTKSSNVKTAKATGRSGSGWAVGVVRGDGIPSWQYIYQNIAVTAGKIYNLKFYYVNDYPWFNAFYAVRDNTAGSDIISDTILTNVDAFTLVNASFVAPSNCTEIQVRLGSTYGHASWVRFDDVELIGEGDYCIITMTSDLSAYVITCDVKGAEDVGDGTGVLIENPVTGLQHFLNNWIKLNDEDINTTKFTAMEAIADTRGYSFAGAIYGKQKGELVISRMCQSMIATPFFDIDGNFAINIFAPVLESTGISEFSDQDDILRKTFVIGTKAADIFNKIQYFYDYDYVNNVFLYKPEIEDNIAITDSLKTYPKSLELYWTKDLSTAQDIAGRWLLRYKYPLVKISFNTKLAALNQDLTDSIHITHFSGLDSGGYDKHLFEIMKMKFDPDKLQVTIEADDVEMWSKNAFFLGDRTTQALSWGDATEEDQRKYGYLCDRITQDFSDQASGKRLY